MNPYPKQNMDLDITKLDNGKYIADLYHKGKVTRLESIKVSTIENEKRTINFRVKYTEPEIPDEVKEFHKQTKGKK